MSENSDIEERLNSLAEKLRAMLTEKLGEGWERRRASAKRTISLLFGIAYAHELDEIREVDADYEKFTDFMIAARAGLAGDSYGP